MDNNWMGNEEDETIVLEQYEELARSDTSECQYQSNQIPIS